MTSKKLINRVCPDCWGRGKIGPHNKPCKTCDGTGRVWVAIDVEEGYPTNGYPHGARSYAYAWRRGGDR